MTAPHEEMACQTCLSPLNTLGMPPTYIHPTHLATDGHEPAPIPVSQLDAVRRSCDFCGDPYPIWTLHGGEVTAIAIGPTTGLVQDFGDSWAACAACQTHIDEGRNDKVIDRAIRELGLTHQHARQRIEELHLAFLNARLPGRTLITTTTWPATTITAAELPKVRDRLTRFYRGTDNLPATLGITDTRQQIAAGLERSHLYWIDNDFTDLAEHAAGQLPDVHISRDLIPSANGILIWPRPVTHRQLTAASWTDATHGRTLVLYRSVGGGLHGKPLQRLREQVGSLAPASATHLSEQHVIPGDHPAAALVATWLLIAQQTAEVTTTRVDKAVAKTYARTNRPVPELRIVRIRGHRTPSGSDGQPTPGSQERSQTSRFWVSGHWRNQAHGPGRSLRRPVYIHPFLRGPDDAPIKLSTTVRMLRSHQTKPQDHK
ncbi:hypothetical protein O7631_17750 [Micromonospora sp. WMMD967]|uniref:hypothetical protein n=1 Tax=Micromonospora sp. WMMD967 TaxID=3016101 RepID=UPI0024175CA6|nr:hypothetical protein [Micromonospora sp. WMMD967]MDG4838367.1 hypothetical protein [Micromonospora sp. WMMD967]